MRFFFITLLIILVCNPTQAQKALNYTDYVDYYKENVKSTVLIKEGDFLKNGKYKFTGSPKDFKFLLSYVLKYNLDDFKSSDTLTYEGEIKDSIKVNVWRLILNRQEKPLDLIYRKEKNVVLIGVDFSSKDNKYGLVNEMINLNQYDNDGYLGFIKVGGIIKSYYDFGEKDYYINTDENYFDNNNKFRSYLYVTNKKNNKTIYSETSFHRTKVEEGKMRLYEKESFFQYNDSCSLEIKITEKLQKNNNKINKYIWENIVYSEIGKNKFSGDVVITGKSKFVRINITEGLKDDKLVKLQFDFDNKEIECVFNDFLKTNYYPIILYDKTPLLH